MANSRFKVKGSKDFLVIAVVCAFFCLWFLRDGWFPPKRVRRDHPLQIPVSMAVSGVVKSLPAAPGREVGGSDVLVELYDLSYRKAVDEAELAYEEARKQKDPNVQQAIDHLLQARSNLTACVARCSDFMQTTSHGEGPLHGVVLEHLVAPSDEVVAGQNVLLVRPKDGYYLFNQTSCILSFIGAVGALLLHRKACG